jgi:Protein of unknown function (DUF3592)
MSLDTTCCYRLTNQLLGADLSLDVYTEAPGELQMSESSDSDGQSWTLIPAEDGRYELRNSRVGDGQSLDVRNDGVDDFLCLAPTADVTGQAWTLTPWGDGTYRLTNDATGPDKHLDVRSDTYEPCFGTGDSPGTRWTLSRLDNAVEPAARHENTMAPRRARKVANAFFVVWGLISIAALAGGLWMLNLGQQFRASHREAQATVAVTPEVHPRTGQILKYEPRLQYDVAGKRFEIAAPPESSAKSRNKYREHYQNGRQISVWYPNNDPQSASEEGDRGVYMGGIVFTAVGALFSLAGILVAIAEFYPNRVVRFG